MLTAAVVADNAAFLERLHSCLRSVALQVPKSGAGGLGGGQGTTGTGSGRGLLFIFCLAAF